MVEMRIRVPAVRGFRYAGWGERAGTADGHLPQEWAEVDGVAWLRIFKLLEWTACDTTALAHAPDAGRDEG